MSFNLLDYPITTRPPRLLSVSPGSVWVGHIPFAMALVQMTRPRQIVELGTHAGDSYCAFCEAVVALGLETRCTAIDTWTGDRHSGLYGAEVLGNLKTVHDPAFGRFSRLLQSRFDEARDQFPDGSIDLLHIDGLHTYEAVRHDYQTWLPKMSDRGVILFHDTVERGSDFGVWRLWDELRVGHRHFNFLHASGLGVLAVGASPPAPLVEFFDGADGAPDAMRALFAQLGSSLDLLRTLRGTVLAVMQVPAMLGEWGSRTGRPGTVPQVDVNGALSHPLQFAGWTAEQVRLALTEDLQRRKL